MTLPAEIESVASELIDRFAESRRHELVLRDSIEAAYVRELMK